MSSHEQSVIVADQLAFEAQAQAHEFLEKKKGWKPAEIDSFFLNPGTYLPKYDMQSLCDQLAATLILDRNSDGFYLTLATMLRVNLYGTIPVGLTP